MVIYFSATGTNKYVAQELAKATGEAMLPLKDLVRNNKYNINVAEGENLGIVMPTYWEGLPSILLDYLEKARFVFAGSEHMAVIMAISCPRHRKNLPKLAFILTAYMRQDSWITGVRCFI